jgi:hypothetical protein
MKDLTPEQFSQGLETNFTTGWIFQAFIANPRLMRKGTRAIVKKILAEMRGAPGFDPP